MTQTQQIEAVVRAGVAILEAIVALGSVPSGHLYARLMSKMSLGTYETIISSLVSGGLLTNNGHLLEPTAKGRALIASGGA